MALGMAMLGCYEFFKPKRFISSGINGWKESKASN